MSGNASRVDHREGRRARVRVLTRARKPDVTRRTPPTEGKFICGPPAPVLQYSFPPAVPAFWRDSDKGCVDVWPPRSYANAEHVDHEKLARCLSEDQSSTRHMIRLQLQPPCTARLEVGAPNRRCVANTSVTTFDVCTIAELTSQLRTHRSVCTDQPQARGATGTASSGSSAVLWDMRELPGFWNHTPLGTPCREVVASYGSVAQSLKARYLSRGPEGRETADEQQPTFKTCAVVGGAPSLLGAGLGDAIDSHDAVLRFNDHPFGGNHSHSVGSKLTIHMLQGATNVHTANNEGLNRAKRYAKLLVQIRCASKSKAEKLLVSDMRAIRGGDAKAAGWGHKLRIMSPNSFITLLESLGTTSGVGGTGMLGIWLAMQLCEKPPTLYGFSTMAANFSQGFVHYYRGANGEAFSPKFMTTVAFLHILRCLGLLRFGEDMERTLAS